MPKSNQRSSTPPEKKFGPYPGGVGVAVWLNTIDTDRGQRQVRSITISPRRYRDAKTGEWKDSSFFSLGDLPALIFALEKAQEFCYTTPLSGQDDDSQGEVPY